MRKKNGKIYRALGLALAVVVFAAAGGALADSVLGTGHYGIPVQPADARSRALGGASAAIPGEDFSFTNPARAVNFRRSGFNCVLAQDYRTLEGPSSTDKLRSTEFLAFRGVFPTVKQFVVSWGIFQARDLEWVVDDQVEVPYLDGELKRSFASDGGLYVSRIGVARSVAPHLAVGLGLDWMIGRTRQSRTLDFGTDSYLDGSELYSYRYSCFRPTLGLLAGYRRFSLGLSLSVPQTCDIKKQVTFSSGYLAAETVELDYPALWRIGAAVNLTPRSLVVADLEYEGWGGLKQTLEPRLSPADQWRFCLGYELLPSTAEQRRFYRKVPLRVGYSRTSYPFRIDGEPVYEQFFTFGTGVYFGQGGGLVDIACEIGKRRAVAGGYPEEGLFRLVVSLSAFEKWVSRPRRK